MKDLGEASYIFGIQIIRDRKNKLLALSQASYIDKVLAQFSMQDSMKGLFVKPRENPNFLKNGKMVISVKIWNFSRSRMTKQTSPLESFNKI